MTQKPNNTPPNHDPELLAIWLFGACGGDETRFAQLRLLTRRAIMDAKDMYETEAERLAGTNEPDAFGVIDALVRFAAKLDEVNRLHIEDERK